MKNKTQKKAEPKSSNNQRSEVQLNDLSTKKGEEIKGGLRLRT